MELDGARVTGRHASPSLSIFQLDRSITIEKPSFFVITTESIAWSPDRTCIAWSTTAE